MLGSDSTDMAATMVRIVVFLIASRSLCAQPNCTTGLKHQREVLKLYWRARSCGCRWPRSRLHSTTTAPAYRGGFLAHRSSLAQRLRPRVRTSRASGQRVINRISDDPQAHAHRGVADSRDAHSGCSRGPG